MIEIYLLEQLVGLSEYSTLSEAAEHLHITQPTLTRSIQKLEALLGAELFCREKNRIYFNDNGKLAVEYARRILECEDEMINAVRILDRSRRTISIGSCAPAPNLLIEPKLKSLYPEMQITAEIKSERELLGGLKRGEFQLITLVDEISEDGLYCQKIGTEHLQLSVLPAHPAAVMDNVSFADIDGGSFLVYSDLGIWESIVREHMPDARLLIQSGVDEYAEVVNSSSLPTFDSDWGVIIYGKKANRVNVPIEDEAAKMTFYAVYREADRTKFYNLIENLFI